MKKLVCLLAFIVCTLNAQAQNIVLNGNFENYTTCPNAASQIDSCIGWTRFTLATCDYFNTCGTNGLGIPNNQLGVQATHSGNGYVGGFAFENPGNGFNVENLSGLLSSPMKVGVPYEVSVSVSLSGKSAYGINGIGVYFHNGPVFYSSMILPSLTPQVAYTSYGIITDTVNWVRLSVTYYPDSAYNKIVIGNWQSPSTVGKTATGVPGTASYYYYDSLVVKDLVTIDMNYTDSLLCAGNTVTVPYTVNSLVFFEANNVFTLQLSDATGSFTNPLNIGTQAGTGLGSISATIPGSIAIGSNYRLRIVSSNPVKISNISTNALSYSLVQPTKPVISATTTACTGHAINLTATTTTPGVTYLWKGPNGFTANTQSTSVPNAVLAAAGDYIVTAKLAACLARDTETIAVNVSPLPITAGSNSPLCQYTNPLSLTATNSSPGTTYSWSGPSFTAAMQNPSVTNPTPAASGDYIVSANLNGCIEKDTVTVSVLGAPGNVNATANTPVCTGQALGLAVTNSTTGVSYSWVGPSFTSTQQNPVIANVTMAATGDYIATLSLNGCIVKDTTTVVIKPTPPILSPYSNSPVCNGNTLNLYSGGSVPGASFNWSGPSFSSNTETPVISNVNSGMAGLYSVTASLNGCTSPPATTNVSVQYFASSVSVYVLPNDTICTGSSIQLIGVASNGGTNPQYKWLKNGFPVAGANSISYTTTSVANKDKFSVVLTPDNTCPELDTSQEMEITVLPYVTPSVSITASPSTLISPWQYITFTSTPINGGKNPTYQWKRNGQDVVGAVNDTWGAYTLSNNDVISVVLYSNELCPSPATATSNEITVNVKLGVDDVDKKDLLIYPNPSDGIFTIAGKMHAKEIHLLLTNALGQVVHRQTIAVHNNELHEKVQLAPALPNGIYYLQIDSGLETVPLKITLQR
jgi:hypothetical protein